MLRPLFVPFALATVLAPLAAQADCSHTKAVEIPASAQMGPARACNAGIDVEIGGFQITDRPRNCPFFVIYTPTHHAAQSTADSSYAYQYSTTSEVLITLACVAHRFLFIKIDTSCDITSTSNSGPLPLMYTRGCADVAVVN